MGQLANILDARRAQDRTAASFPETARLIPGAQLPSAKAAAEKFFNIGKALMPAVFRPFSPDALGAALVDAGVIAAVFITDRVVLNFYLPFSTLCFFLAAFGGSATSEGLYDSSPATLKERFQAVGKSVSWATIMVCLAQAPWATRSFLLRELLLSAYSLCALCAAWQLRITFPRSASATRNVVLLGQGVHAQRVANAIRNGSASNRTLRGILSDATLRDRGPACLSSLARREFVDEVMIATEDHELRREAIREAIRNQLDVSVAPELGAVTDSVVRVEYVGGVLALSVSRRSAPLWGLAIKRVFDVALSSIGLIVLLPLLCLIAALVWLDGGGPILYRAQRVGKKGAQFTCYKFRTMVVGADQLKNALRLINERQGAFFKLSDDPRTTRVGRFLRRYSLDELPQLWNVLRGEMSLVGPRPHPPDDVSRYQLSDLQRLDFVPGMTGLWQVTGRSDPSFENSVALDRQYISQWELWLDCKILLRTFFAVLQGSGI